MTLAREGASLDARYSEPSVDLATLVDSLGASIVPTSDPAGSPTMRAPLLTWDAGDRVLRINTWAVLSRFWKQPGWKALLDEQKGFVRDAPVPRSRLRAHVGGRIVPHTESELRLGMAQLIAEIDAAIDNLVLHGWQADMLTGSPSRALLDGLARQIGCRVDELLAGETRVERVTFGPVGATQRARQLDVARVLTAIEDQQGDRAAHIDLFAAAVRGWLEQREYDDQDIQAAVRHHRERASAPHTQLARYLRLPRR